MGLFSSKTTINDINVDIFKSTPVSYTTSGKNIRNETRKIMLENYEMKLLPYEVIDIILDYIKEDKFYEETVTTLRENTKNINKVVQISEDEVAGIVYNDNKFIYEPQSYINIWNIKTGKFDRSLSFSDIVIHDIFSVRENELIIYGATKTYYQLRVVNLIKSPSIQYIIDCNNSVIVHFRGVIKLSNGWIAIIFNDKFIQCFERLNNRWKLVTTIQQNVFNAEHKSTVCDLGNNLLMCASGVYYHFWNYATGQEIANWKDDDLWQYNHDFNLCDYPHLLKIVPDTNIVYCITNNTLRIWNVSNKNYPIMVSRSTIEKMYFSKFCDIAITENKYIFIETTDWKNDYIYMMNNNLLSITNIKGHIIGVTKDALICTCDNVIKIIK